MASLMWHKTHKSGASKGDLYTLPAAEALRPHKAAERPCRYQEARRTTAPGEDTETGKRRGTRQDRAADSSAPAFTLTAKPITTYHFISLSAERRGTWRLCHAWPPPWFPASPAPTFLATYPFGTLRKITLEQIT